MKKSELKSIIMECINDLDESKRRHQRGQSPAHVDTRGYNPSWGGTSRSHKVFGEPDVLRNRATKGSSPPLKQSMKDEKIRKAVGRKRQGYTKGDSTIGSIKNVEPRGSFRRIGKMGDENQ